MALNFYLGDRNHKIKVQTNATYTDTLDESLDAGYFKIAWNKSKHSIAPMTKFIIEDTDINEVWNFVILKDEVEIVRRKPEIIYLHNLTIEQNTAELLTYKMRNSLFYQPFNRTAKVKTNMSFYKYWNNVSQVVSTRYSIDPTIQTNSPIISYKEVLNVTKRNKIKNGYITIKSFTNLFNNTVGSANYDIITNPEGWQKENPTSFDITINKKNRQGTTVGSISATINSLPYDIYTGNESFFDFDGAYYLEIECSNFQYSSESRLINNLDGALLCNVNVKLELNNYYYSLYDVLSYLQKQSSKVCKSQEASYSKPLFYMMDINSEQGQILDSIIAPDLSFTSTDVFSAISETLLYIDAVPTLDENNVLGFEFLNDIAKVPTENIKIVDLQRSIDNKNYENKIISNYQNGRTEHAEWYPSKELYRRINTDVYGVPSDTNYIFSVPHKIDYIDETRVLLSDSFDLFFGYYNGSGWTRFGAKFEGVTFPEGFVDLTPCIYEESLYANLPFKINGYDAFFPCQQNTLKYAKGGDSIYLGAILTTTLGFQVDAYQFSLNWGARIMFGIDNVTYENYSNTNIPLNLDLTQFPNKQDLKYNIKYHAIYDGRVMLDSFENKHDGEFYANQSNGSVQLNRMGTQMQGLIAKLGTESRVVSLTLTHFDKRLKKGSLWVDDDGNKYIANTIKTSFSTKRQNTIIEVEFIKNYNAISQFTTIDQEKRFYEISESIINKGCENINEFVYLSLESLAARSEKIAIKNSTISNLFFKTLGIVSEDNKSAFITCVAAKFYESIDDDLDDNLTPYQLVPSHFYGAGNTLFIESGYESSNINSNILKGTGTSSSPYIGEPVFYSSIETNDGVLDTNFLDKIHFEFVNYLNNPESPFDFPSITTTITTGEINGKIELDYYKRPNEILHFNYGLTFISLVPNEIIIGDSFIQNNGLFEEMFKGQKLADLKLYISTDETEIYSIIDKKVNSSFSYVISSVSIVPSSFNGTVTFSISQNVSGVAWAIGDKDGNLYFGINEEFKNKSSFVLYWGTSHHRLT